MAVAKKPRKRKKSEGRSVHDPRGMTTVGFTLDPGDIPAVDRDELADLLEAMVPWEDACRAIGIRPAVFARWMQEPGEDQIEPQTQTLFRMEMHRARSRGVAMLAKAMTGRGETNRELRHNAWRLMMAYRGHDMAHERLFGLAGTRGAPQGGDPSQLPSGRANAAIIDITPDALEATVATLTAGGVKVPKNVLALLEEK